MTKNMKQFLIFGVLFVLGTALFAQTEADFEVALTEDGNGAVIKKYTGTVTKTITIPATIEGLPVREIGEAAFSGVGTVSNSMGILITDVPFTVVLPQGLVKIGENAFAQSALTSVVIPDSVTEIGDMAFANYEFYTWTGKLKPPAPLLTSVTLPSGLTKVGRSAFWGNSALKTVVIPEGCPVLGESMFEGCTALTEITIPKSVASIPSGAFEGCAGLKTLVLPEGLTEIAGGAFSGCTALTSVTLPSTITAITAIRSRSAAFSSCSALTTVIIPDSVVRIDGGKDVYGEKTLLEWAFPECGKLNLATQARLKKIEVVSFEKERQEQARKQREQEEEARRAQEKLAREEREAQAQREREEREAQARREQEEREEREAQAKREREEREAQAKREWEKGEAEARAFQAAQAQREQEAQKLVSEMSELNLKFLALSRGMKMNKKQFTEFMDAYPKALTARDKLEKLINTGHFNPYRKNELDVSMSDMNGPISYCLRAMTKSQKKEFDAKFR